MPSALAIRSQVQPWARAEDTLVGPRAGRAAGAARPPRPARSRGRRARPRPRVGLLHSSCQSGLTNANCQPRLTRGRRWGDMARQDVRNWRRRRGGDRGDADRSDGQRAGRYWRYRLIAHVDPAALGGHRARRSARRWGRLTSGSATGDRRPRIHDLGSSDGCQRRHEETSLLRVEGQTRLTDEQNGNYSSASSTLNVAAPASPRKSTVLRASTDSSPASAVRPLADGHARHESLVRSSPVVQNTQYWGGGALDAPGPSGLRSPRVAGTATRCHQASGRPCPGERGCGRTRQCWWRAQPLPGVGGLGQSHRPSNA
jgi:hypothetical protein